MKANAWDGRGYMCLAALSNQIRVNLSSGRRLVLGASVSLSGRTWFCLHLLLGCRTRELISAMSWGKRCSPAGREALTLPIPDSSRLTLQSFLSRSSGGGGAFNRPDQSPAHPLPRPLPPLLGAQVGAGLAGPGARPAPPPPLSGWWRLPRARGGSAGGAGRPVPGVGLAAGGTAAGG